MLRKVPGRVRKASEFVGSLAVDAPLRQAPIGDWTLEAIRAARDDQMRGKFKRAVRLAEATRTDDAVFVARNNRLAPIISIESEIKPASGKRGEVCAKAAACCVFASKLMLQGVLGTLADHGIAIMKITRIPNAEGTRVDFHLSEWPLEHVWWNSSKECLETSVRNAPHTQITHGDGTWIVVQRFEVLPWTQDACLLPIALIWAGHAYGLADWAGGSKAHGQSKVTATLPGNVSIEDRDENGTISLSPEARTTLQTLHDMVSGEAGAGLFMHGTELDFISNGSNAWQVFTELVLNREKAAARVYQGTDATMGSQGGAPGVDISFLFGVASTKVQGDLEAVCQAMNTGAYQPWAAMNYGDSRYAPELSFKVPDPDASRKSEEESKKQTALMTILESYKKNGIQITQAVVNMLAKALAISPELTPQLASGDTKAVPIELAPTDVAKIVRVGPALRSLGLELFGDERDGMTITELDAFNQAKADAQKAQAEANASAAAAPPAPPADSRNAALAKLCKDLSALRASTGEQ